MTDKFYIRDNESTRSLQSTNFEEALAVLDELYPIQEINELPENWYAEIVKEVIVNDDKQYKSVLLRVLKLTPTGLAWQQVQQKDLQLIYVLNKMENPKDGFLFEVKSYPMYPVVEGSDSIGFFNSDTGHFNSIPKIYLSKEMLPTRYFGGYFFLDSAILDFTIKVAWGEEIMHTRDLLSSIKRDILRMENRENKPSHFFQFSILDNYDKPDYDEEVNSLMFRIKAIENRSNLSVDTFLCKADLKPNEFQEIETKNFSYTNFSMKEDVSFPNTFFEQGFFVDREETAYPITGVPLESKIKIFLNREVVLRSKKISFVEDKLRTVLMSELNSLMNFYAEKLAQLKMEPSLSYVKFL